MKKVLFATTALVATAGVAAADINFGGYGRFGVKYTQGSGTDITSRFRLTIDTTAETDAGMTVGARVRLQQDEGKTGRPNGARFFARSGGFEVGVGNIFGAIDSMPGMFPIDLGLTGLGYNYTAYAKADGYSSGGKGASGQNGVEVMYSMGDFSAHVSVSEGGQYDSNGDGTITAVDENRDRIAAHVAYKTSGWTFALGAQDSQDNADTKWVASVGGSFGAVDVGLAYADNGTSANRIVLSGRFDVGAATNVEAYIADHEGKDLGFGVDFNHDLGGGVSLRGGAARLVSGKNAADFGVRFNF